MKQRSFLTQSLLAGMCLALVGMYSCKQKKESEKVAEEVEVETEVVSPFFELSLAQWSMHRMIRNGTDPYTFAESAKAWGFSGLEYVSQLYSEELDAADYSEEAMANFVAKCNEEAEKHGLKNVLIMIDGEGDLAADDKADRDAAIENHKKWIDAAAAMGCHAVRVNLSGSNDPDTWMNNSIDGLGRLADYGAEKNINVIVENHGGLSSNASMLASVMRSINKENCGTLPDFGNFCIRRNDPTDSSAGCAEEYDKYQGVTELMAHAKAVSAKSHVFDSEGNESNIDYVRMLQIVKDAGYSGYIGVEYEGSELSEEEGIIATRDLLINAAKKLN
ncbi:MAG: sugar phosphate isomerase/epimerase [Bacteroidia bacterium]|nr:sugar phosphate isomerase/epimerase [Bacteroidia bacterium]